MTANPYAARFTNAPAPRVPQASSFWIPKRRIEMHVFRRTPLHDYLIAPYTLTATAPRCLQIQKLDNGDLLVIFTRTHLERAIAHIRKMSDGNHQP